MKILEVNVDDNGKNGVYSLVKTFITNVNTNDIIDIAAYEPFEDTEEIDVLRKNGCTVHYIGYKGNKILKQFICFYKLTKLVKCGGYDCVHIHFGIVNKSVVLGFACKFAGVKRIILHSHASGVDGNNKMLKVVIHKTLRPLLKLIGTDRIKERFSRFM